MQRPFTTNAVPPEGRIINSHAVDYQTIYIHIIRTVISLVKLTDC